MRISEKVIRKLSDAEFMEVYRIVMLEAWRRMVNILQIKENVKI